MKNGLNCRNRLGIINYSKEQYAVWISVAWEVRIMVLEKIKGFIVDQLGVDESVIGIDTNLMKDLEADSLDAVEIIMAIEEEFDLEIPDDDAEKFRTVRDLVEYVETKV